LKIELKGVENKSNLVAARALRPLQECAERRHLDGRKKDAESKSGAVHGRFENAFSNAPIGMALIDMNGCWLQVNNALCRITGHTESELRAKTLRSLTYPEDVDLDLPLLRKLLDGEISSYQVDKRCSHAWGHHVWMMMTVSLVRDEEGHALYLMTQFQDISERKELAGRLEYLVDHDFLTGLFNLYV
jgi:PAS domain S-box-containing protein